MPREIIGWAWGVALLAITSSGCGAQTDPGDQALVDPRAPQVSVPPAAPIPPAPPPVITPFEWQLPRGFRQPVVPADNPMSVAKVELGRHIFYDKRLSDNQTFACASCHEQAKAFADGRGTGLGSTGESHPRGPMSLANVGYSQTLTWANPQMTALERQAEVPIFGDHPVELGMMSPDEVESRFRALPRYQALFAAAFPDEAEPITMQNVLRALATFERTLISGNSAYDRFQAGDPLALSESAQRGMQLVTGFGDLRFECNHCHAGFTFTDQATWQGSAMGRVSPIYHQTGLYDVDGNGGYPEPNTGVYSSSMKPEDMGKFKTPTLRNIALTAPYMHDGSIATLAEVLDHYEKGGRAQHPGRTDPLLKPFALSDQERTDVLSFFESLTDLEFVTNPAFADPWPAEQ